MDDKRFVQRRNARTWVWAIIGLGIAVLLGCEPLEPIRIGFVGGTSGRVADLGIAGRDAVLLAVELRNQSGGVAGRKVKLLIKDDQQSPELARRAVRDLIEQGVVAIVGPMTSAMAIAVVPIANEAKVLLMSPTATTDDLTGLINRRAWDVALEREVSRARRGRRPLAVAMLDLDRFKAYNDLHGHQAGDRVLREAASAWRTVLRETDLLARYGGEEFAVALPGCDLEHAGHLVNRLREVTPAGQSCSAGLASWDGDETADALLGRADDALYEAKQTGRDRTVVA